MGRTTKTNKAQATQTQQAQAPAYVTREELNDLFASLKADIAQMLERKDMGETPKAQPTAQPKADKDGLVPFTNKAGVTKMVSQKQYDNWTRKKEQAQNRTPEQEQLIETIKANKAAEPERTRKLEKLMGLKANTLENTAVSVKVALEKGWKPKASDRAGRKEELRALKAKIRG